MQRTEVNRKQEENAKQEGISVYIMQNQCKDKFSDKFYETRTFGSQCTFRQPAMIYQYSTEVENFFRENKDKKDLF